MEENHIYTTSNVPRACYGNVDDTFAITSHYLGKTLLKLNDFNENIEFTWKKRNNNKVFRKPIDIDQFTHFSSSQPLGKPCNWKGIH